jgi:hypothetical protein
VAQAAPVVALVEVLEAVPAVALAAVLVAGILSNTGLQKTSSKNFSVPRTRSRKCSKSISVELVLSMTCLATSPNRAVEGAKEEAGPRVVVARRQVWRT